MRLLLALLLRAAAAPTAVTSAGPTLKGAALVVALDGHLPRPLSVLHTPTGTNLTAVAAAALTPRPPSVSSSSSSTVPAVVGPTPTCGAEVKINVGCYGSTDGGPSADRPVWGTGRDVPNVGTQGECCALCSNRSSCAAWTWNGPHGNHYCYGYAACVATRATKNLGSQMSGTMNGTVPAPLPGPPPPPPSPGPGPGPAPPHGTLPQSAACISAIAPNGSATIFCAGDGEVTTVYSDTTGTATRWSTTLSKPGSGVSVLLAGSMRVAASAPPLTASSELVWTLTNATSKQMTVRAIDLGFGFLGLSEAAAQHYTTHQFKTWCPPATGCQEWHGGGASCTVGGRCDTASATLSAQAASPWHPPEPLPWAYTALLTTGRSAFTGGAGKVVGYSAWSSQAALPFQSFGEYTTTAAIADQQPQLTGFSSGSARINTNLRCGDVLPVTLKFGVYLLTLRISLRAS